MSVIQSIPILQEINITRTPTLHENATGITHFIKHLSPAGYNVAGACLIVVAVLGIFNNLCVLILMTRNRHLRTPVNMMLLNLSISDLTIATLGTPLTAGAALANRWIYGSSVCRAYAFAMAITGIASITSLAVISMERYLLVARPGTVTISKRKTALAIIGVWAYAFLVTFPPLVGWNSFELESSNIACAPNWESFTFNNSSYIVYLFIFGFICPMIIILYCYSQIIRQVLKQTKTNSGGGVAKGQGKITRMVMAMIAAFLFAWLPYAFLSLIVVFGGQDLISASAAAAPAILAKSSLIYNPVIYVFMNSQIKAAFVTWITCGKIVLSTAGKPKAKNGTSMRKNELKTGAATFNRSDRNTRSPMGSKDSKDSFNPDINKSPINISASEPNIYLRPIDKDAHVK